MIYVDENYELHITEDAQEIVTYTCLQELALWTGENEVDCEAGVDYKGVLNGETFLKSSVEDCLSKYSQKFKSYSVGDATLDGEVVSIDITIVRNDGETIDQTISLAT